MRQYQFGVYNVDDFDDEDNNVINIKALDNIIKLDTDNGYYDASQLIKEKGTVTLGELAQDICKKKGLELETSSFLNSGKKISVYDDQLTAREYMSYIAECACGFCCANRTGKICFKTIGEDEQEIEPKLLKTYNFGEEHKISKVIYNDGVRNIEFGDDTGNTLSIRSENIFIVDEEQIENIYNKIKGLIITSFKGTTRIDPAVDIGDKLSIKGKTVIFQGELTLNKRFMADISSEFSITQREETTVKKESQASINRKIYSSINQIDGKITQVAQETSENSEQLTKHEQSIESMIDTVSKIETKENEVTQSILEIEKKAEEMTIELSKKINDEQLTGAEIALRINEDTSEAKINADKIELTANDVLNVLAGNEINLESKKITITSNNFKVDEKGEITATAGKIGGFNLNETSFIKNINGIYDYSLFDALLVALNIMGDLNLTDTMKDVLDVNSDGNLKATDYMKIKNILNNTSENTKQTKGSFEINADNAKKCLVIKDEQGNILLSLGIGGINSEFIVGTKIVAGTTSESTIYSDSKYVILDGEAGDIITTGDIKSKGNLYNNHGKVCEMEHRSETITPSAANTPTGMAVTFKNAFSATPNVAATPNTTVPGTSVLGVGISERSTTGFMLYITRTSTNSTGINWIAMN